MITTNNLVGIHARLLVEGRVSATSAVSVDGVEYAIQEQSQKLAPEEFFTWMEQLFDVPVDQNRLFAGELNSIALSTGNTPAKLLVDELRRTMPVEDWPEEGYQFKNFNRESWLWLLFLFLALVGLICTIRYLFRVLQKIVS